MFFRGQVFGEVENSSGVEPQRELGAASAVACGKDNS